MDTKLDKAMTDLETTALRVKAERDTFRLALVKIMDLAYAKEQDEITRINDMYDCACDALGARSRNFIHEPL